MGIDLRLSDLDFGNVEANKAYRELREAVERANRITIQGAVIVDEDKDALAVYVPGNDRSMSAVAATGGITAASGSNLGVGDVTLRFRTGAALVDGPTVVCYSNMPVSIAAGTRLEVEKDGDAYKLVTAHCAAT